jgi:hypothetical protein
MNDFIKGTYTIESQDERVTDSRYFGSGDAIREFVSALPRGRYGVSRVLQGSSPPGGDSEPWARMIHHLDGQITVELL